MKRQRNTMQHISSGTRDTDAFTILKSWIRFRLNIRRKGEVQVGRNVYPRLNVLFVHIPKTAGTSIHATLAAADDALTRTGEYNSELEKLLYTYPGNKHLKAYQWRQVVGERAFQQFVKLTIVRNPWDLMVSSYEWWRQKAYRFPELSETSGRVRNMSFAEFLRSDVGSNGIAGWRGELRDWYQYRGVDIVDSTLKFEELERAIPSFLSGRGLPTSYRCRIPRTNITLRSDYREYYEERDIDLVGKRFEYDVRRFGYSF